MRPGTLAAHSEQTHFPGKGSSWSTLHLLCSLADQTGTILTAKPSWRTAASRAAYLPPSRAGLKAALVWLSQLHSPGSRQLVYTMSGGTAGYLPSILLDGATMPLVCAKLSA